MPQHLPRLALALALAATCVWCSCKRFGSKEVAAPTRAQLVLGKVSFKAVGELSFKGREVHLDARGLTDKVRDLMVASRLFSSSAQGPFAADVSIVAEPLAAPPSAGKQDIGVKARLRVSIRPEQGADSHLADDTAGVGQTELIEGGDIDEGSVFDRLAERTIADLVRGYVRRQKLWEGDVASLRSALTDSDTETRVEAIRIVGARKLHALADQIVQLLSDEDEDIRDAALGALVAMREQGVVKALADSHQMRDTREVRKVLDAIATLGGREAEEYLGFVAQTHDDEEIRDMAKSALERLRKRGGKAGPTR